MPITNPHTWPRLSESLIGPVDLAHCQACGCEGEDGVDLHRWQEHDLRDRPEPIILVLCRACGDWLIEKHPRLYRPLDGNEPFPGAMSICEGCCHRQALRCMNPRAKANGGEGVAITIAPAIVGFRDGRGADGRRCGSRFAIWPHAATGCAQREEA